MFLQTLNLNLFLISGEQELEKKENLYLDNNAFLNKRKGHNTNAVLDSETCDNH